MAKIAAILAWIKLNWTTLVTLLVLVAGWFHLNLKFQKGPPGSNPEIIIILPDEAPKIIRGKDSDSQKLVSLIQSVTRDPSALDKAIDATK